MFVNGLLFMKVSYIWPNVRINVHVAPYVCDNGMLPAYCKYWYIVNQFVNGFYEPIYE